MSYLTPQRIQQWLEKTKFTVTDIDVSREQTSRDLVFGRVVSRYDTSAWLDDATTPTLVLNLMSGYYAAYMYNSIVSEDMGQSDYAPNLIRQLNSLLDGISNGELDIIDEVASTLGTAAFFPTDVQDTDEQGNEIKFTMGVCF